MSSVPLIIQIFIFSYLKLNKQINNNNLTNKNKKEE